MESIVEYLADHARRHPAAPALTYLEENGERLSIDFGELHRRALHVAEQLAAHLQRGDRAVLLLPQGIEYVQSFLGCLYAGVVAVPLYPPTSRRHAGRVRAVIDDCGATLALANDRACALLSNDVSVPLLDIQRGAEPSRVAPRVGIALPRSGQLAFLQYTSGSTGTPKGVMVSHGNVLANLRGLEQTAGCGAHDVFCNWLPLFHDLGLVTTLLLPIYLGAHAILMSPAHFMRRPRAWLEAISEYRASIGGAPNFAFEHCVTRVQPEQLAGLDLSCWRIAFNAAEPIDAGTLDRFVARFAPARFAASSLYPAYGMAEATVFVTAGRAAQGVVARAFDAEQLQLGRAERACTGRKAQVLIGCGWTAPGHQIRVVAPHSLTEVQSGEVGEIWFAGPSVAQGYWNDAQRTQASFGARLPDDTAEYLRTGDLGFVAGGELFIAGRSKDVLIIKGRNLHPQDLERIASQSGSEVVAGSAVAFEHEGTAILAIEVTRAAQRELMPREVFARIQADIVEHFEIVFADIVLLSAGSLPRTSSGKLQRALTRQRYLAADFEVLATLREPGAAHTDGAGTELEQRLVALWEQVLGVERIAIDTSFLALGGHSLLAAQLVARIRSECNCAISVQDLFAAPSVRELAVLLAGRGANPLPPVVRTGHAEGPLSYMQQSLWLVDQIDPHKSQYNLNKAWYLRGPLAVRELERAFEYVLQRQPVLRTTIHVNAAGEPRQRVADGSQFSMEVLDLSSLQRMAQPQAIREQLQELSAAAFDLSRDSMLRVRLVRLEAQQHVLLVVLHHIACDGWSEGILVREVSTAYRALLGGQEPRLPPLDFHYIDYAQWQRNWLQGPVLAAQLEYWRERLADLPPVHSLRLDHPRPALQRHAGGLLRQRLEPRILRGLHALAQQQDVTLFMLLNAALAALLARHCRESDIVIGVASANRDQPEFAATVGYFVNTLVLRIDCSDDPPFEVLLQRCREYLLGAYEHQQLPFQHLVDELQPTRNLSHSPLYQIKLALQNNDAGSWELPGLAVEELESFDRTTQHDLSVDVYERGGGLEFAWEYATALFEPATIERLASRFALLLQGVLHTPRARLHELPLLTPQEQRAVLLQWNDTAADHPRGRLIPEIFEAQVARDGDAIALIAGTQQLSYAQLNREANRVARYLREQGAGRETLVGLCTERSAETLIGILGILKAGAAYVPIDPGYPQARIQYVLRDAAIELVLTQRELLPVLPLDELHVLPLDAELRDALLGDYSVENLEGRSLGLTAGDLAYVIYTSGSTGEPKGVMIEHESVCNLAHWQACFYQVERDSRVAQFATYSFDGSVGETFMALLNGATLVMLDRQQSPAALLQSIDAQGITTVVLVPSLMQELDPALLRSAERLTVVAVGEACPVELAQKWARFCNFCNGYGPTECTVYSHIWTYPRGEPPQLQCVPIGKPMHNIAGYVLDEHRQPVPPGVVGELYLSGVGLARGYLNRPDLTVEKFCRAAPLERLLAEHQAPRRRFYRTGDLVVQAADGNLEFVGRIDQQVKLRGMRIELGEIEAALQAHGMLSAAAVMVCDEPERLVAYLVPARQDGTDEQAWEQQLQSLRQHLQRTLPHYMVPAAFVRLAKLPLTPIGKIDRKALPVPEPNAGFTSDYVPPTGAIETQLCALWELLLKRHRVGVTEDFFDLGGHSLLAVRLVAEIRARCRVELAVRAVFEHKTIRQLARAIEDASATRTSLVTKAAAGRPAVLSFAQQRLWLVQQIEPDNCQYNIPLALRLEGELNVAALALAFNAMIARHQVLRTVIQSDHAGEPVPVVRDECRVPIAEVDLTQLDPSAYEAEVRRRMTQEVLRPFDLANDLMMRVELLKFAARCHVLLITLHHIASDGWSAAVLMDEFSRLYRAFGAGESDPLPEPELQYADYAQWQRDHLRDGVLETALQFWKQQLQGLPAVHNLPLDHPRPAVQDHRGAIHRQVLGTPLRQQLEDLARRCDCTLFMVLSASFAVLLARHSNEDDIVIGMPVANREQAELAQLVGFFTNALVLRTDLTDDPSFEVLLQRTREALLGAYEHQQLPFEKLVEELQPGRNLAYSPLFQVKLALQNNELGQLNLQGLTVHSIAPQSTMAKHDLSLDVFVDEHGMTLLWEYATALFERSTIERLAAHYEVLLAAVVEEPRTRVGELPLLTAQEQQQLLVDWNEWNPNVAVNP